MHNIPLLLIDPAGMSAEGGDDIIYRNSAGEEVFREDDGKTEITYEDNLAEPVLSAQKVSHAMPQDNMKNNASTENLSLPSEQTTSIDYLIIVGDITGANQVMSDTDYALDVYEAEG